MTDEYPEADEAALYLLRKAQEVDLPDNNVEWKPYTERENESYYNVEENDS